MTDAQSRLIAESQQLHPDWDHNDHLLNLLVENARRFPDQVAMRERDRGVWQEYTWSRYLDEVLCFAAGLEAQGVKPEDIVLVIGDNRPALYFSMLGAIVLRA
ncbi:MAG TPA: AMP-binding protein, partial [Burkholderiaceae bacterium]|nr:AMP-binding protein [Burkholderiaceae bacterium]